MKNEIHMSRRDFLILAVTVLGGGSIIGGYVGALLQENTPQIIDWTKHRIHKFENNVDEILRGDPAIGLREVDLEYGQNYALQLLDTCSLVSWPSDINFDKYIPMYKRIGIHDDAPAFEQLWITTDIARANTNIRLLARKEGDKFILSTTTGREISLGKAVINQHVNGEEGLFEGIALLKSDGTPIEGFTLDIYSQIYSALDLLTKNGYKDIRFITQLSSLMSSSEKEQEILGLRSPFSPNNPNDQVNILMWGRDSQDKVHYFTTKWIYNGPKYYQENKEYQGLVQELIQPKPVNLDK